VLAAGNSDLTAKCSDIDGRDLDLLIVVD